MEGTMTVDIIPMIAVYGPAALFFVYFFYGVSRAHKHYREVAESEKKTYKYYIFLQYFVAGGIAIIIIVSHIWYTCERCIVQGSIEKVPRKNVVTPHEANSNIYMNEVVHSVRDDLNYKWIIKKKREHFAIGEVIFSLGSRSPSANTKLCEIVIKYKREYELSPVKISWNDNEKQATLIHKGEKTLLQVNCEGDTIDTEPPSLSGSNESSALQGAVVSSFFVQTAYAEALSDEDIAQHGELLLDYNPALRVKAKRTLIDLGVRALPWAFSTLANSNNTVQQRLSALSLIINITSAQKNLMLSQEQLEILVEVASGSVSELHMGSIYLLKNNVENENYDVLAYVSSLLDQALVQHNEEQAASYAWVKAELLYKIGIISKDKYGDTSLQDLKPIDNAIAHFEDAWELRKYAHKNHARFLIALWGWGNALHDLAWTKRLPLNDQDPNTVFEPKKNRKVDPQLISNAKEKFKEFIQEYDMLEDKSNYLYKDHIERANRYVLNPDWKHLLDKL